MSGRVRFVLRRVVGLTPLVGVLLALGGCIPAPVGKYYQAQMSLSGARYSGSACHGQSGAPAVLHVTLAPGVDARIDAMPVHGADAGGQRPLHIAFEVPRHTTLRFGGRVARVSVDDGRTWRDLPLRASVRASVSVADRVAFTSWAPTALGAIEPGTFEARAALSYQLPHYAPQRLTMTIPAIVLADGAELAATQVEAQRQERPESYPGEYRTHRSLIYTTAASRAALVQRTLECQRRVAAGDRTLHCDNLRIYDPGGFKVANGPFAISGQWSVFDLEGGAPFTGELQVAYRQPLDWRFAQARLQLLDEQGRTTDVPIQALRLSFSYDLPLDAAVQGVGNTPISNATAMTLLGSLGDAEAPRYLVQLPTLIVNGTVVPLPPIDLRRHLLGFELAPFNC